VVRTATTVTFSSPRADARSESELERWQQLSEEIRACQRCPLHKTRTQAVVYRGSLTPQVLFVGEAPGATEDHAGLPFVGRSGQRLDAAIDEVGLTDEDFGVLNILKCHPPGNQYDPAAERACRPYLDRQLAFLAPKALVSLGAHAFHALAPNGPAILAAAGRSYPGSSPPLFPLIHPAAAMRSRRLVARWAQDVTALGRWLAARPAQPV
jgi:uracil-DNA glycosylase